MRAHSDFNRDDGMSTVSWAAWIALRIRVRKSAMGSVLALTVFSRSGPLPRRLGHARDEAVVGHLAQADPAQAELAIHGAGPAATAATAVLPGLELRRPRLADPLRRLGHLIALPLLCRRRAPRPGAR